MNIAARVRRLEQMELEKNARGKVCFCVEAKGHMWIRELDFFGTSEQARTLMQKHPQNTYIIDDIAHPNWGERDGEDLESWLVGNGRQEWPEYGRARNR